MTHIALRLALLLGATALAGCAPTAIYSRPIPLRPAPDSFLVTMVTSTGTATLKIHRAWAPWGADRFYQLVRARYYDETKVFRVVPNFVAQWGLAADPVVTAHWKPQTIPDDSVRHSNLRGTISFARSGRGTRTTQLFINLIDNARLDIDGGFGFPPFGEVVSGMEAVDAFSSEYNGKMPGAVQDSISRQGNAYLERVFPNLAVIRTMRVSREWRR